MTLRVLVAHKTNPRWEAGEVPTREMIASVGAMIGQMAREGVLEAGEGLRASSQGVRLTFAEGRPTATPGPFAGTDERFTGFAIVRTDSLDAAVEWATRYAAATGTVEIDVRPVTEASDLGIAPAPSDPSRRYMLLRKATGLSAPRDRKALAALAAEMRAAGVLLSMEGVKAEEPVMRATTRDDRRTYTDGPFMETKELLAGFVILRLASREALRGWLDRYATTVGAAEVDALVLD